ncbi:hypothetical protein [Flavobacterium sp.]|uniref:hypothetical protein n=1 Tax=Flavobacterium sp. TaxID=239 RepID=UPI0037C084D9
MDSKMKTRLQSLQHLFVALILIPKGYDKIAHHYNLIGWIILLMGMVALGYFIYQKTVKRSNHFLAIGMHLFESIALFLTTYVYFIEGKTFLPYITGLAGIGFLIATIVHLKHSRKTEES